MQEVRDKDNTSANEQSWDDGLLEEQVTIDDTSQSADEELNLYFSAARIAMNAIGRHTKTSSLQSAKSPLSTQYLCPLASSAASERELSVSETLKEP